MLLTSAATVRYGDVFGGTNPFVRLILPVMGIPGFLTAGCNRVLIHPRQ